jgi:hypothetical protein
MEISFYNEVADQIKLRELLNLFKNGIKFFLLKHYFYSIDELKSFKF